MMYYGAHFLSAERADNIYHLDNDTLKALGCLRNSLLRHRLSGRTGCRGAETAAFHRHEDGIFHQQAK